MLPADLQTGKSRFVGFRRLLGVLVPHKFFMGQWREQALPHSESQFLCKLHGVLGRYESHFSPQILNNEERGS